MHCLRHENDMETATCALPLAPILTTLAGCSEPGPNLTAQELPHLGRASFALGASTESSVHQRELPGELDRPETCAVLVEMGRSRDEVADALRNAQVGQVVAYVAALREFGIECPADI